jgi:hypothetical protein
MLAPRGREATAARCAAWREWPLPVVWQHQHIRQPELPSSICACAWQGPWREAVCVYPVVSPAL